MHTIRQDVFGEGAALPAGFLSHITATTVEDALYQFAHCPAPPNRPDLRPTADSTTTDHIGHQISLLKGRLGRAAPGDVDPEALLAIGAFTLESSIYRLLNAWGNLPQRTVEDLKDVAPFLRLLVEALWRLPSRYRYEGFGVRVLDASIPVVRSVFDNYEDRFGMGESVDFHSVCCFGRDEKLMLRFIERDWPIIVLQCSNVEGYLIEDISAIPNEIIVEGPSFFTVIAPPVKIRNYIVVQIEYNSKGNLYSYLPKPSVRVRNRPEPLEVRQEEEKLDSKEKEKDAKERREREAQERKVKEEKEAQEMKEKERMKEKEIEVLVIQWGLASFCCGECKTFYKFKYYKKVEGYKFKGKYEYYKEGEEEYGEYFFGKEEFKLGDIIPCVKCKEKCIKFI